MSDKQEGQSTLIKQSFIQKRKISGGKKEMKRRTLLTLLIMLLGLSFVLAACDAATEDAINDAAEQVQDAAEELAPTVQAAAEELAPPVTN